MIASAPRAGGGTELSSQLGQGWGLKEGDRFVAVTCCVLQARRFSQLVGMVILQKKIEQTFKNEDVSHKFCLSFLDR